METISIRASLCLWPSIGDETVCQIFLTFRNSLKKSNKLKFNENGLSDCHALLEGVNEILLVLSYFLIYLVEIRWRNLHVMSLSNCEYLNFSSDLDKIRHNDVNNQQDATIFVYWSIWICSTCFGRQTRPSSGALLTVYTALVQRSDIAADRWQGWDGTTVSAVGSNTGALYQSCIYSQKCSWRWASLSPETCRADSNESIKRSINENYCILLVAYLVGLKYFNVGDPVVVLTINPLAPELLFF